jgi:hypothetical protein
MQNLNNIEKRYITLNQAVQAIEECYFYSIHSKRKFSGNHQVDCTYDSLKEALNDKNRVEKITLKISFNDDNMSYFVLTDKNNKPL